MYFKQKQMVPFQIIVAVARIGQCGGSGTTICAKLHSLGILSQLLFFVKVKVLGTGAG